MTPEKQNATEENESQLDKRYNRFIDETKTWNEYLKHIATLDTGLIVIIAAFLGKFTNADINGQIKWLVAFATSSLVFVAMAQILIAILLSSTTDNIKTVPKGSGKLLYLIPSALAYVCFLVSLLFLVSFIVKGLSIT